MGISAFLTMGSSSDPRVRDVFGPAIFSLPNAKSLVNTMCSKMCCAATSRDSQHNADPIKVVDGAEPISRLPNAWQTGGHMPSHSFSRAAEMTR